MARRWLLAALLVAMLVLPATGPLASAWGNGDPASPEWPNLGVHDITCDIALRTATYLAGDEVSWLNDWYLRNQTDWGYSFDPANAGPTLNDNVNSYTDDPDSHWMDWDNHTLYLHPRSGWPPAEGDAARRVSQLYNMTRDHLHAWLMNGSVRYDPDEHHAAYYGGLMAHYVMDVTQFGHTDWTLLDHSHPADDPLDATYHSYYEAWALTDRALRRLHVDLMGNPLPDVGRCTDPHRLVLDLVAWVNGRHGPPVQFTDADAQEVTVGSTYHRMLTSFVANWDANVSHNGARGYDQELWDLTLENLLAGMDNLTCLWTSAYLDAREMFLRDAADLAIEQVEVLPPEGAYDGLRVEVRVSFGNVGNTSAEGFNVTLLVDDEVSDEATASAGPDEHTTVTLEWTAVTGSHDLEVVLDSTGRVPERDEGNNLWNSTYDVSAEHHASRLTADPSVLALLQDDAGSFQLTLENRGNRDDVYVLSIEAAPGTLDISVTIHEDEVLVGAGTSVAFSVHVSTRLEYPVGNRAFTVVATGGNSTANVTLAVVVSERQVAPFIEVVYPFYGNVSVPVAFDASGSWDHNGDPIAFSWDFGDGATGTGAVVEHAYAEVGDYVITLTASDGELWRRETLEVSVQDAIPPAPVLSLLDVDVDAAIVGWVPWNGSRYFNTYRVYASEETTGIVDPENLAGSIGGLPYIDHMDVPFLSLAPVYVVLEVENIYLDRWYSEPLEVVPVPRVTRTYTGPLADEWLFVENVTKTGLDLHWREWSPLFTDGYYVMHAIEDVDLDEPPGHDAFIRVEDLSITNGRLSGLFPGKSYGIFVHYVTEEDWGWRTPIYQPIRMLDNVWPNLTVKADGRPTEGDRWRIIIELVDPDDEVLTLYIEWGDGSFDIQEVHLADGRTVVRVSHVYEDAVEHAVTFRVRDNTTGDVMLVRVYDVEEAEAGLSVLLFGIVLILLVAAVGTLAGIALGYFRMGKEGGKVEDQEAEEDEEEREPTVAELEAMIPRDRED